MIIESTFDDFKHPIIQSFKGSRKRSYTLVADYQFTWFDPKRDCMLRRTVFRLDPACDCATVTDLASVPSAAGVLGFQGAGPTDGPSVLHDMDYLRLFNKGATGFFPGEFMYLDPYDAFGEWQDVGNTFKYTRANSDADYRKRSKAAGYPGWKANVEWLALRVGAKNPKSKITWRAFFSSWMALLLMYTTGLVSAEPTQVLNLFK